MSVKNDTITFYEGNIQTLSFTLTNSDLPIPTDPLDLTNLTMKWALSKLSSAIDADPLVYLVTALLEKTEGAGITITVPATDGLLTVRLATVDTAPGNSNGIKPGNWYWELEATDAASERTVVSTGTFTILKNVVNT